MLKQRDIEWLQIKTRANTIVKDVLQSFFKYYKGVDKKIYSFGEKFTSNGNMSEMKNHVLAHFEVTENVEVVSGRKFYEDVIGAEGHSGSYFVSDETVLVLTVDQYDNETSVYGMSLDENVIEKVGTLVKKHAVNEEKKLKNDVYCLLSSRNGLTISNIGQEGHPLERDNYSDDVLRSYDYVIGEMKSETPDGRLALLQGVPGTGKSFFIKAILSEEFDGKFILFPAEYVQSLSGPDLLRALISFRDDYCDADDDVMKICLIIEDADLCLMPRESGNTSSISTLLNFTDGIFGSLFNIRIVATTNMKMNEFDDALTRPGRLIANISVDKLDALQCQRVYRRLTSKDKIFDEPMTLAEVYKVAKDKKLADKKIKNKVGF